MGKLKVGDRVKQSKLKGVVISTTLYKNVHILVEFCYYSKASNPLNYDNMCTHLDTQNHHLLRNGKFYHSVPEDSLELLPKIKATKLAKKMYPDRVEENGWLL